jgi:SET domain-containing protein
LEGSARTRGLSIRLEQDILKNSNFSKGFGLSVSNVAVMNRAPQSIIKKTRGMKKKVIFSKSNIHDWGMFALETIMPEEFVIEYIGEVIRNEVCNLREKEYISKGIGCSYMFRIDKDYVLDATHAGNEARFINHSCDVSFYLINIATGSCIKNLLETFIPLK